MNGQQKTERIFAPEARALKEIEAIIGRKPRVIVENRRIAKFSVSWYNLSHDELYPALEILFKHCKNLKILDVGKNQLTSLPSLPKGLTKLYCYGNQLTSLPELPKGLTELHCHGNKLTFLPELPDGLTWLDCSYNQLTSLPELPDGLTNLNCSYNQLTSLPSLLDTLTSIIVFNNPLTEDAKQRLREFKGKHPNATVVFDE